MLAKNWDNFFWVYMILERLNSNQGTNFDYFFLFFFEKIWLELPSLSQTESAALKTLKTESQSARTLGSMLRTLPIGAKHRWSEQIHTLTFPYVTNHETTSYAPFF